MFFHLLPRKCNNHIQNLKGYITKKSKICQQYDLLCNRVGPDIRFYIQQEKAEDPASGKKNQIWPNPTIQYLIQINHYHNCSSQLRQMTLQMCSLVIGTFIWRKF